MHNLFDPILSEEDLAKWLDTSRPTLQRQRSDGSGPPFVQLSERRIGYRKSAIERWLVARTINRVGTLASVEQAPKPAANFTATVTCDDSETGQPRERSRSRRARANGDEK
jgi:predicted DNA-binding transcriptional regulator AlpA